MIRRFLVYKRKEFVYSNSVKAKEIPFTNKTATKLINYILGDDTNE